MPWNHDSPPERAKDDTSVGQKALYDFVRDGFEAIANRDERQDATVRELSMQTATAVATMNALVEEMRADRRERDASLGIEVRKSVRDEVAQCSLVFAAQIGEVMARVETRIVPLQACVNSTARDLELLSGVVRQKPDREEFERVVNFAKDARHEAEVSMDRFVARVETEIDGELRGENGLEKRVKASEEAISDLKSRPGRTALKIAGAVGGTLLAANAKSIVEGLKHVFTKGGMN